MGRTTDLSVAIILTMIGVYLIVYGLQAMGELVNNEVTAQNTFAALIMLVLPLIGVVLIASSIIVLVN